MWLQQGLGLVLGSGTECFVGLARRTVLPVLQFLVYLPDRRPIFGAGWSELASRDQQPAGVDQGRTGLVG
jgi:hypothetical protein